VIAIAALILSAFLAGCGLWRPTPVPMRTLALPASCTDRPTTLLVFLPGSYSRPEDFVEHGFVSRLRAGGVAADVLLVDAHLGYYSERSILERLRVDVLAPARARGYRDVWLVGISIGGYGALAESAQAGRGVAPSVRGPAGSGEDRRGDGLVAGLVVIAPYLGDRGVSMAIAAAGGLRRWPAPAVPSPPHADDETLWRWLQRRTAPSLSPMRPQLFLAYGDSDRFEFSDRLLAAALPPGQVFTAPGGHDWPVWEALWQRVLPALSLPRRDDCASR